MAQVLTLVRKLAMPTPAGVLRTLCIETTITEATKSAFRSIFPAGTAGLFLRVRHHRAPALPRRRVRPTDCFASLAAREAGLPACATERVPVFPLGSIAAATDHAADFAPRPRSALT